MKIDPPGGSGSKVPELPDDKRTGKVEGTRGAGFSDKLDETRGPSKSGSIDKLEGAHTSQLREILGDLDAGNPNRLEIATDRMVDWVLEDTFGKEILEGPRASELRSAIRDQLLDDPGQTSRIQKILDRL